MTRRGAALLELMAALVLLAMTAAMSIPLLRDISTPHGQSMDVADIGELAAFADAWMASASASTMTSERDGPALGVLAQLTWERRGAVQTVELEYRQGDRHGWFSFTCGGVTIVRYLRTPPLQASAEKEAP